MRGPLPAAEREASVPSVLELPGPYSSSCEYWKTTPRRPEGFFVGVGWLPSWLMGAQSALRGSESGISAGETSVLVM